MSEKTIAAYFIGLLLSMDVILTIYDKNIRYRDSTFKKIFIFVALFTIIPYLAGTILLALIMW